MKTVIEVIGKDGKPVREIDATGKTTQQIWKLEVEALRNFPIGHFTRIVETVGGGEA
jgi:hypothetical protein